MARTSYENVFEALGFDADEATIQALRGDFAAILRAWMRRENLTQAAAGERLGVPQSVISNIVTGRTGKISVEYLIRLLAKIHIPWTARCWDAPSDACVVEGKAPQNWVGLSRGTRTVEAQVRFPEAALAISVVQFRAESKAQAGGTNAKA